MLDDLDAAVDALQRRIAFLRDRAGTLAEAALAEGAQGHAEALAVQSADLDAALSHLSLLASATPSATIGTPPRVPDALQRGMFQVFVEALQIVQEANRPAGAWGASADRAIAQAMLDRVKGLYHDIIDPVVGHHCHPAVADDSGKVIQKN